MTEHQHAYEGWANGEAHCGCGRRFESVQDYERHLPMTEHQSSEEGAEGLRLTEAERESLAEAYYTARTRHSRTAVNTWGQLMPFQREQQQNHTVQAAVERILTDRLAAAQAEACTSYGGCDRVAEVEAAHGRALVDLADANARAESAEVALAEAEFHIGQLAASRDRAERQAESAEAENTRLRAQVAEVEALPQRILNTVDPVDSGADVRMQCVTLLRAALASPTSHAQREADAWDEGFCAGDQHREDVQYGDDTGVPANPYRQDSTTTTTPVEPSRCCPHATDLHDSYGCAVRDEDCECEVAFGGLNAHVAPQPSEVAESTAGERKVTPDETTKLVTAARPLQRLAAMLQADGYDVVGIVLPLALRPRALPDPDLIRPEFVMGMSITWGTRPGLVVR